MRRFLQASLPFSRLRLPPQELGARLLEGDRLALSKAITLVESYLPSHREYVIDLLDFLNQSSLDSNGCVCPPTATRVGICGAPGAGKSTFIESSGLHLVSEGHKLGVVAVDPSSVVTGGSILGDKTRMERLSRERDAFIRPSPSEGFLGGVAPHTFEIISLMEYAGVDTILIETVGIGQSEVAVSELSDVVVLVVPPYSGDELQGIKRGVMEIADFVLVNKHDGSHMLDAERTQIEYARAIHMMQPKYDFRGQEVLLMSSLLGTMGKPHDSVVDVWNSIFDFADELEDQGGTALLRREQKETWVWRQVTEEILTRLFVWDRSGEMGDFVDDLKEEVCSDILSPRVAAERILERFLQSSVSFDQTSSSRL